LAGLPVPLFLLAIVALKLHEPKAVFDHPYLLLLLNFVFSLVASAFVVALLARAFVMRGTADLLLFGCGLSGWGLAGLVAVATGLAALDGTSDNTAITVHNLCVWLAGAGQLAGAVLTLRPRPLIRRTVLWLTVGHVVVVALVGVVVIASLAGWTPAFFVQGRGGTLPRQAVMVSASAMFGAAAALIRRPRRPSSFESWYAAALAMIAVGLLGVTLQTVHGGLLGWAGRSAQFLSGIYLVVAAVVAARQSRVWGVPLVLAAREAAERYQRLFDASSDGAWIHGLDGRVREVNDAYCRMSGYSRDEIVGMPISRLEANGSAEDVTAQIRRVLDAGGHARFESRHRRKDGTVFDVDVTAVYLRIGEGQIAISVRDVTDRKRAEELARQRLAEIEDLYRNAPVGLCVLDRDLRFLRINERLAEINGIPAAEHLGRRVRDLMPELADAVEPEMRRVLETGEPRLNIEIVAETPAQPGVERSWLEQWLPLRDSEGRVTGLSIVVEETTERRRAAEALQRLNADLEQRVASRTADLARAVEEVRAERQRFLEVLDTLPVMVMLIRPDFRVTFANRAWRGALGEARGRTCYDYQFGRDGPCEECQAFVPLQTGQPHHWEWTQPDGRTFDIHDFPFTDADGSPMVLEMAIDITERRRAERELRAAHAELAARAEQLRRLAGELTLAEQRERRRMAKVLHDHLQQLLVSARFRTAILGRAGDRLVAQATGEIEELLDQSIQASRSLTAELSPPILHEGGLKPGLEWLARWMADRHGLVVDLSVQDPLPSLLEDVKVLLFESVRELLFNAVKHARVRTAAVNLRRVDGQMLQITVSDSGPGFDPAALARVGSFDPAALAPASGFGLFSIRERLSLIGGRFEIHSSPGNGSRFMLIAPLSRVAAAEARPEVEGRVPVDASPSPALPAFAGRSPRPGQRIRVLLADDHAVMREGLARLIGEEADMEVVGQARDGNEAVRLAATLQPDVVLMDVSMPGLDGVEATRAIHGDLPHIRIIGLSMFEETERAQAMRDAGAECFLTKSGPAADLLAAIRGGAYGPRPAPVSVG
jgi:PAS domain S-box-containing protein